MSASSPPRLSLSLVLAIGAFAGGCGFRGAPPPAPPPNVVVVVVDALRADRLGIAGYARALTPNLDRLAGQGVYFKNAYSQATWTKPSIATLMTSLYPTEHGLVRLGVGDAAGGFVTDRLPDEASTLAERFQSAGYRTFAVVNQVHLQGKLGFAQGFDSYQWRRGKTAFQLNGIVESLLAEPDSRPLFAWVHYLDVHWPYLSRLRGPNAPDLGSTAMAHEPPQGLDFVTAWARENLDASTRAALVTRYDHEVAYADAAIGELVGMLEAAGRYENTILVVTADHGESFGEHGPLMHGHLPHEEELRVPLVMRLPNRPERPSGARSTPVGLIDLAPTLLDLAGVPANPPAMHGVSLVPVLAGEEWAERPVFAQTDEGWSVRVGRLKLLAMSDGSYEHYDLQADPGERTNLAAGGCTGSCEQLLSQLRALRVRLAAPAPLGKAEPLGAEDVEELRALGYL